jgi:hypothetical protein
MSDRGRTSLTPLRAVLSALDDGAPTLATVAARTGLPIGLVRLAVDQLVAAGVLSRGPLVEACATGCGGCPLVRPGRPCLPVVTTRRVDGAAGPAPGC